MSGVQTIAVTQGEAGARLDRWFKRRWPHLTHGRLEKLLRTGQVRVDGARAKASQRLEVGQAVRVPPLPDEDAAAPRDETVSDADAEFIRGLVIHEDADVIVLDKPSGLAVQGGSKTTRHIDALLGALAKKGADRPRLAHRLDRDTSGVLLLGKTAAATAALAKAFQSRQSKKTYWAVTVGVPTPREGEVKGYMKKITGGGGGDRETMGPARHGDPDAVFAKSRYAVVEEAGRRAAWVALRPETGRTHQLRVHMAALGTAILGDRKYTCDREAPTGGLGEGLHLHARAIETPHPSGGVLHVEARLPPHMEKTFSALGFHPAISGDPFEGT